MFRSSCTGANFPFSFICDLSVRSSGPFVRSSFFFVNLTLESSPKVIAIRQIASKDVRVVYKESAAEVLGAEMWNISTDKADDALPADSPCVDDEVDRVSSQAVGWISQTMISLVDASENLMLCQSPDTATQALRTNWAECCLLVDGTAMRKV